MDKRYMLLSVTVLPLFLLAGCKSVKVSQSETGAQTDIEQIVMIDEDTALTAVCPRAELYLPGYPAFEDSEAFFNDSVIYQRSKVLRDTPRGELAIADVSTSLEYYLERFGTVMGVTLSCESTPAIAEYVETTFLFARSGISNAKNAYHRLRPYRHFGEPSGVPGVDMGFDAYQSYPSGHSVRGWAIALALSAIDEADQYRIIKTGYELGESRVIVGYHYESDVMAARLAASVAFARLASDRYYIKLMRRAQEELENLKSQITDAAVPAA